MVDLQSEFLSALLLGMTQRYPRIESILIYFCLLQRDFSLAHYISGRNDYSDKFGVIIQCD